MRDIEVKVKAEPFASKYGDQRSHFYVWDQFWARSARVEVVVDAAAQPSRNGSEGEQD